MTSSDPIEQAFIGDHRQTEQTFETLQGLVAREDWVAALQRAQPLARALQSHIDVEEGWVYPEVDRYARQAQDEDLQRTLAILHKRHLEIPAYADEMVAALEDRDAEEAEAALELLARVVADHHRTEESDVFPLFMGQGPLSGAAEAAAAALRRAHAEESEG